MPTSTETILGYPVSRKVLDECVELIRGWLDRPERSGKVVLCANPHSLVLARKDILFQQALQGADLLMPDGAGILLASKILGGTIRRRVTGSDIFWAVNEELERCGGGSCFFLGSSKETLNKIVEKMGRDYPQIHVAGSYSPPYTDEFSRDESRLMLEAVNRCRPDILWVGLTAPKQEKWIMHHRDQLEVKTIGAIGAVFDFFVGNIKRSHPLFQQMGLEWLPRLIQEPRRLFRRNFISSPIFLLMIFRQFLAQMKQKKGSSTT